MCQITFIWRRVGRFCPIKPLMKFSCSLLCRSSFRSLKSEYAGFNCFRYSIYKLQGSIIICTYMTLFWNFVDKHTSKFRWISWYLMMCLFFIGVCLKFTSFWHWGVRNKWYVICLIASSCVTLHCVNFNRVYYTEYLIIGKHFLNCRIFINPTSLSLSSEIFFDRVLWNSFT